MKKERIRDDRISRLSFLLQRTSEWTATTDSRFDAFAGLVKEIDSYMLSLLTQLEQARSYRRFWSRAIRLFGVLFLFLGLAIPLLPLPLLDAKWGYIGLLVSAGLFTLNDVFGITSGHLRRGELVGEIEAILVDNRCKIVAILTDDSMIEKDKIDKARDELLSLISVVNRITISFRKGSVDAIEQKLSVISEAINSRTPNIKFERDSRI